LSRFEFHVQLEIAGAIFEREPVDARLKIDDTFKLGIANLPHRAWSVGGRTAEVVKRYERIACTWTNAGVFRRYTPFYHKEGVMAYVPVAEIGDAYVMIIWRAAVGPLTGIGECLQKHKLENSVQC